MVRDSEHERAVVQVSLHPGQIARRSRKADSSIVESSIGEIPVTIGGEVDCVDGMLEVVG